MYFFHTIIRFLFVFIVFFVSFGVGETFATNHIIYINSGSSSSTIKKLQNVFSDLGLYSGKIDGKYDSLEDEIIDFQLEQGIIPNKEDDSAGYYGIKTATALEEVYGQDFLSLQDKYLTVEALETYQEGYFTVTAYYTPVQGQEKYQKGSYEADIRLNGKGITASGKEPEAWMLALPRNYKFGTKIYLDGIGVGVVEDRGGAIVNSGENGQLHDRIDIWTGYGDEGRERAIYWGKRKVSGFIVDEDEEVTIEFWGTKTDLFVEKEYHSTEKVEELEGDEADTEVFENIYKISKTELEQYKKLRIDAEEPKTENVEKLQRLFTKIWLYTGEITGEYQDIEDELITYQKSKGITAYLGYFGKITYGHLEKDFAVEENIEEEAEKILSEVELEEEEYILSNTEKKNIQQVKEKLEDIFSEESELLAFRKKLEEMSWQLKTEKQKAILIYLIEIL